MDLLIKNARLVDREMDRLADLYVSQGKIAEIGEDLRKDCRTLDARGYVLMPGFIDLHAHFREPGFTHKEDLESGSRAAVRGGYTTVNLMANTNPIASTMEVVDHVLDRAREIDLANLHQTVSLTFEFDGKTTDHLDRIDRKKVKFLSDDGHGVVSNIASYRGMLKAKEEDYIIMTHAEDMNLTPIDYRISENIITFRDIYLAQVTGARLHLSHVSTKEAIEAIRQGKKEGVRVTCEVTPHHIALWDNDYRVNPPIRERADTEEIIRGIKDGTVDAIATDHAPHTALDKEKGAPGLSGLESSFSICYTSLVEPGHISLKQLSDLMSYGGAKLMDLAKGRLAVGYDADLVLVDLDKEYVIRGEDFVSRGKNTPFDGRQVKGQVVATIKDGDVKYQGQEYTL